MSLPPGPDSAAAAVPPPPPPPSALGKLLARTLATLDPAFAADGTELVLAGPGGRVRVLSASREDAIAAETSAARDDYSPRLWSRNGDGPLAIEGAALDRAHAADRRLAEAGARSVFVVPFGSEAEAGGVWILRSPREGAFDPARASLLAPLAEFLAAAADREQAWAAEQLRHRRRVRLEALIPTIAGSLDVRKVFVEMSGLIQEVIPHDVLAFALLLPDRSGVKIQAATQRGVLELPEYRFSSADEALDANWDFLLAFDLHPVDATSVRARISPRSAPAPVEVVTHPGPAWMKFIAQAGVRSVMRVPIRAKDRAVGGIAFMAARPDAYDREDGMVASRIADQLALALAHQKLAEEEQEIARAEERERMLERRVEQLSRELQRFSAHRALGQSAPWKKALSDATQVAATDTTVLITGESGTGKEVLARFIHRGSRRAKGPFVALNCAALPEHLLESELFGHERGAFTGATDARAGRIEQAAGGVLFLDEVGEMSPAVQAKFLRVLQEREFQRVGGSRTLKADVRIVAATNRDPRAGIARGEFREDLYYRLGVFEIHLPPLRERPDDILVLAQAFLDEVGETIGRPSAGLSEDAREQLLVHAWPGNVRELRNAIERAVILCQGGLITREHLPMTVARPPAERVAIAAPAAAEFPVEGVALDDVERELLVKAMAKAGNNKSQAAKLLGVTRGQLYSLLRRHGMTQAKR